MKLSKCQGKLLQEMKCSGEFEEVSERLGRQIGYSRRGSLRFLRRMEREGISVKEMLVLRERYAEWVGARRGMN